MQPGPMRLPLPITTPASTTARASMRQPAPMRAVGSIEASALTPGSKD